MTKHVFVTGGVASSLGKGLTASSLGNLLKARGLRVTMQKLDPYLNVDPGTMNPFQHGEVFVTDDGAETDLDVGHYERFLDTRPAWLGQRHHGTGLLDGHRQGATRRVPRRHRAGDPAHHQRDQVAHPSHGRARRRRRHHRGRRHGRRHRVPAVPGGDPPGAPRDRPRQRLLPPRLAAALHRAVGRAEDQAHAALGRFAAQHRHPAGCDRAARRPRGSVEHQAQGLAHVRCRHRGRRGRGRCPEHLRHPEGPASRGTRRLCRASAGPAVPRRRLDRVGRAAAPRAPSGATR